jgi:hypothetical protein
LKYFGEYDTIGTDLEHTINILKNRYPDRKWFVSNFNSPLVVENIDLVISADVIEHLNNPDEMLNWIKQLSPKFIVLSTPDKYSLRKREKTSQTGPPQNIWHMREWDRIEFANYIGQFFDILEHFNTRQSKYEYQTIVCKPK